MNCVKSLLLLCTLSSPALAGSLLVELVDRKGQPFLGGIVSIHGEDIGPPTPQRITLVQQGKRFQPQVTLVPLGSKVSFVNQDNITHHVYSFSKPWRGQFRLSQNGKRVEILDKPGEVVLGCNIHDWMLGYIYVLDTPYYGRTNEKGVLRFENLPDGPVVVRVRHPRIRDGRGVLELDTTLKARQTTRHVIRLKKSLLPRRDRIQLSDEYE